ncbi:allophanate hydrolase subunit 2 family protein, partial [Streptomyces sp. NPDC085995]
MSDRALVVVRAGALTTVQDEGRPGHAHLGVPRSGALDAPAAALANRLAGNPRGAAVLETTLDGCALRPRSAVTVAVTGAPCPVRLDGRPAAWGAPVRVPAGAVLEVGAAVRGIRAYVAVSGGVAVEPVLGSRSTDLLSGLGPAPLTDGTVLPLGPPADVHARRGGGPPPAAPPARGDRRSGGGGERG